MKSKRKSKNLKHTINTHKFREQITHSFLKCKNNRCWVCNIIIFRKSYPFKNPKTFIMNRNLSYISKYVVNKIKYTNSNEIYIFFTQALNNKISLHESNIIVPEDREFYVLKHFYECSQGNFKIKLENKPMTNHNSK